MLLLCSPLLSIWSRSLQRHRPGRYGPCSGGGGGALGWGEPQPCTQQGHQHQQITLSHYMSDGTCAHMSAVLLCANKHTPQNVAQQAQ